MKRPVTIEQVVRILQDITRSDEEVVVVLDHLLRTKQVQPRLPPKRKLDSRNTLPKRVGRAIPSALPRPQHHRTHPILSITAAGFPQHYAAHGESPSKPANSAGSTDVSASSLQASSCSGARSTRPRRERTLIERRERAAKCTALRLPR